MIRRSPGTSSSWSGIRNSTSQCIGANSMCEPETNLVVYAAVHKMILPPRLLSPYLGSPKSVIIYSAGNTWQHSLPVRNVRHLCKFYGMPLCLLRYSMLQYLTTLLHRSTFRGPCSVGLTGFFGLTGFWFNRKTPYLQGAQKSAPILWRSNH